MRELFDPNLNINRDVGFEKNPNGGIKLNSFRLKDLEQKVKLVDYREFNFPAIEHVGIYELRNPNGETDYALIKDVEREGITYISLIHHAGSMEELEERIENSFYGPIFEGS